MDTVIKGLDRISSHLTSEEVERLENAALQYRKFGRITFKIVSAVLAQDHVREITIEVRQGKNPSGNYLDDKELYQRGKDLFAPYFPRVSKFYFNTVRFIVSPAEDVTPAYIRHYMTETGTRVKDIEAATGLEKSNISAWINGTREMSNIVKVMFYYFFEFQRVQVETGKEKYTVEVNGGGEGAEVLRSAVRKMGKVLALRYSSNVIMNLTRPLPGTVRVAIFLEDYQSANWFQADEQTIKKWLVEPDHFEDSLSFVARGLERGRFGTYDKLE